MNYYKIVRDGIVVDANCVFLQFRPKYGLIVPCEARDAHYIQSSDQADIYRVQWLNPLPPGAPVMEIVEAVEIEATEYAELREQLDLGESVEYTEPEEPGGEEPEPEPVEEYSADTVLTPSVMRRILIEQNETIRAQEEMIQEQSARMEMLEECLLEMSEIVYA